MRGVVFAVSLLFLVGCSTTALLDTVNPLKESKGITANAQLGKENHLTNNRKLVDTQTQLTETYTYDAENIGSIDNSTNIPWWALIISLFVGILVRPIEFIKDFKEIEDDDTASKSETEKDK